MSARILLGLGNLTNKDNVKEDAIASLSDLEKRMIEGGIQLPPVETAPEDRFRQELRDVAERSGISFDDIAPATSPVKFSTPMRTEERSPYERVAPERDYVPPSAFGTSMGSSFNRPPTPPRESYQSESNMYGADSLQEKTDEQERRGHIESVVGESSGFNLDSVRNEDLKCAHLAEIDTIRSSLESEDIDTSRLPKVDSSSSYEDVNVALKVWRHRSDQSRCVSFAEEGLSLFAWLLQDFFDGKTVYFGRFRPDMTGYHNQMHAKLKRIRHDTGQVVSSAISAGGLGPITRILMELVPNMFIYSRQRKMHNEAVGDFMDSEAATDGVRAL